MGSSKVAFYSPLVRHVRPNFRPKAGGASLAPVNASRRRAIQTVATAPGMQPESTAYGTGKMPKRLANIWMLRQTLSHWTLDNELPRHARACHRHPKNNPTNPVTVHGVKSAPKQLKGGPGWHVVEQWMGDKIKRPIRQKPFLGRGKRQEQWDEGEGWQGQYQSDKDQEGLAHPPIQALAVNAMFFHVDLHRWFNLGFHPSCKIASCTMDKITQKKPSST